MDPFTISLLANAGFQILGGARDIERIDDQKEIETTVNNANIESEKADIMKNYTGIFSKMVSDLGSQISVFATAGVDKAGTLFNKGLQKHEKAFLDNKGNMISDLKNSSRRGTMANIQSGITAIQNKDKVFSDIAGGMMNSFMNYNQYQTNRGVNVQRAKS